MGKMTMEDKSKHFIQTANLIERSFADVTDVNTAVRLTLILLSSYGHLTLLEMAQFRQELEIDVRFNEGRKEQPK